MAVTQEYLSLQGTSYLARNTDGKRGVLRELGNQTSVQLSISSDTFDIKESKTGKRGTVKTITKERSVEIELKLDEQKREDIALAFQAESLQVKGKKVSDSPITLKVGETVKLDGFNLQELTVKDSKTSTPTNLTEGEHYKVDKQAGTITLLKDDSLVMPLLVSYTEGNNVSSVLFSLPDGVDYYYLFNGVNSLDNKRVMVELWNFQPAVDTKMDLINDELGEIVIKGKAHSNANNGDDPKLGAFGRIVYVD